MIKLAKILNEESVEFVNFDTFLKNVILSYPMEGYDNYGNVLVHITLRTKPNSNFKFKYEIKKVKIDDYITDRRLPLAFQIKEKIYKDFYLKQKY
jgi:hypothetical protein